MDIKRLKELRVTHGFTQLSLAEKLGFSQQRYSYYENGHREPDHEALDKIADFFAVSVDYLLGRDDAPQKKEPAATGDELEPLDASERDLLNLFRTIPQQDRALVLDMIQAALDSRK